MIIEFSAGASAPETILHIELNRHSELPIRSELFSAERLELHAKRLAEAQPVGVPVRTSLCGEIPVIDPVIASSWPKFDATFRHGDATCEISVENPDRRCKRLSSVVLDGVTLIGAKAEIPLVKDGRTHSVHIIMGEPAKDALI